MRAVPLAGVALVVAVAVAIGPAAAAPGKRKPSPTPSPTPTVSTPGPTTTSSTPSPSVAPTPPVSATPTATPIPTATPTPLPTADVYVTPSTGYREALRLVEGPLVEVAADVSWWSAVDVAAILRANAVRLSTLGQQLRVRVVTSTNTQVTTTATSASGVYTGFRATVWLDARSTSRFSQYPDRSVAHEYGHALTWQGFYLRHGASWSGYLAARGIAGDPRIDSSYPWQPSEIAADDYRLLLGAPAAQTGAHMNPDLTDPRLVPGLADFLLGW